MIKEKLSQFKTEVATFARTKSAKVCAMASSVASGLCVAANAAEVTEGASTAVDFSGVSTALTSAVSVSQVLTLVATCIGVGAVFFFAWFGARKLVATFQAALQNGKIKI